MSTPEPGGPGYTDQGERAEQSAFRGDGEYSGGGFAAGPDDLTGADGPTGTDESEADPGDR